MKQKRLLIFDLDGTLIDTVGDLNASVNYALKQFDYPERTILQTRNDIGNGVAVLIARSIPYGVENPNYQACLSVFKDYYKQHYFDLSLPYTNIFETLLSLKKKGYLLAVVSNKFNEGANKMIKHFFKDIFIYIQGENPPLRTKPSPDMVEHVLKELHVKKEEALYIGDTEVDYQTAVNSEIDVILVSYGYRTKEQLFCKIKNAPLIVDAPTDLLKIL